jgi:hypothetical protein
MKHKYLTVLSTLLFVSCSPNDQYLMQINYQTQEWKLKKAWMTIGFEALFPVSRI